MTRPFETAALSYAIDGFRVVPLEPRGKKPLIEDWPNRATRDPNEVSALWQKFPAANIGVLCGDGFVVLDVDSAAGEAEVHALDLPPTPTVSTRRGKHVYLAGEAPTRPRLLPGVELRGSGVLVVGAGSIHPSGHLYKWTTRPSEAPELAPIPPKIEALLGAKRAKPPYGRRPVFRGERNLRLADLAGGLRRLGLHPEAIAAALHAENRVNFFPPLGPEPIEYTARWISRKDDPPLWVADWFAFIDDPRLSANAVLVLLLLARCADDDGTVWGGEWLAKRTHLHRNTIGDVLRQLEAVGRIAVRRRRRMANLITLRPFDPNDVGNEGARDLVGSAHLLCNKDQSA